MARKTRYTTEQIALALQQHQAGIPRQEIVRKYGISQQTFYRWRSKYGGLPPVSGRSRALRVAQPVARCTVIRGAYAVGAAAGGPLCMAVSSTLKYRPEYPSHPFACLEDARAWVAAFVRWYNTAHLHGALRFVSPDDRHSRREDAVLARRRRVYAAARHKHPERRSGSARNWQPVGAVRLNPDTDGRRDTPKS